MENSPEQSPPEAEKVKPLLPLVLGLVAAVLIVAVGIFVLLPTNAVTVALVMILVLGIVGFGVSRILSLPQFGREP